MADDTKDVDVTLPNGRALTLTVPGSFGQDQTLNLLESKRPDLTINDPQYMAMKARRQAQQVTQPNMQESSVPGYFRGATTALPFAGSLIGGAAGATLGGVGALAGGGLGGAAGVQAKLLADQAMFGPMSEREKQLGGSQETSPISREGLTETGIGGLVGAAQEIPAALAIGRGNYLLKTLGQAKSVQQVGDVLEAFKSVNPVAGTRTGLQAGLEAANRKAGVQLGAILKASTGTVDLVGTVEQRALAEAAVEDAGFARQLASGKVVSESRVTNALKDAIQAAKSNAGITGNTANAQQLWKFQSQINNRAFRKALMDKNPSVGTVVDRILQSTSRNSGTMLRTLAPDAAPLLEHMTDIHAGISALQNVSRLGGIGRMGGISVSAALNPKITAILSPEVAAAAGAATQIPAVKKATDFITKTATTP